MVSSKTFLNTDGLTKRFLSDFIIKSEQHCRVYVYTTDIPTSADLVTLDYWDLVDNSIIFYTAPTVGSNVAIEVATTPEEFGEIMVLPLVELAKQYTTDAQASATSSATSAANSLNSAIASANSATASTNSATASANSAIASANSANNSAASATSADASEAAALASEISATTSATTATTQAGIATTQAGIATTKATEASNSASSANTSATTATTQAGIATTKASEASESADEAAASVASINPLTLVRKDSDTGVVYLTAGTTAQRPPLASNIQAIRYNTDLLSFEGWSGTAWGSLGGGATGGGTDNVFNENEYVVTTNYTIPAGKSAVTVGDASGNVTINSGVTVTLDTNSRWVVL